MEAMPQIATGTRNALQVFGAGGCMVPGSAGGYALTHAGLFPSASETEPFQGVQSPSRLIRICFGCLNNIVSIMQADTFREKGWHL